MGDWEQFLDEVSWFLQPGESATVGEAQRWTRGSVDGLPELSALLGSSTLTPVSVGASAYELLAWGLPDDRRGWLCHPRHPGVDGESVPQIHKCFWKVCGGIVERFGEPATWWINQNEVLTVGATGVRVASVLTDWRGSEVPPVVEPLVGEVGGYLGSGCECDKGVAAFFAAHAHGDRAAARGLRPLQPVAGHRGCRSPVRQPRSVGMW